MAFVGARRADAVEEVLDSQHGVMCGAGNNASFTREVGQPLALALKAFGEERYNETVRLIRPVSEIADRFGGSHAQRDLLDLTLIEAALRAGQRNLTTALCAERLALHKNSPLTRQLFARAEPLLASACKSSNGAAFAAASVSFEVTGEFISGYKSRLSMLITTDTLFLRSLTWLGGRRS